MAARLWCLQGQLSGEPERARGREQLFTLNNLYSSHLEIDIEESWKGIPKAGASLLAA